MEQIKQAVQSVGTSLNTLLASFKLDEEAKTFSGRDAHLLRFIAQSIGLKEPVVFYRVENGPQEPFVRGNSMYIDSAQFEFLKQHPDLVRFIIGNKLAIEVKGTDLVGDKHLKGIRAFKEEGLIKKYGVVSLDPNDRITDDGIHIWSFPSFLEKLWSESLT